MRAGDGSRIVISTTRIAPVARVLPRSASAASLASASAMMPEPTTVATSKPGAERLGGQATPKVEGRHQAAVPPRGVAPLEGEQHADSTAMAGSQISGRPPQQSRMRN